MNMVIDKKLSEALLLKMQTVRFFEESMDSLNAEKLIHGTLHLCIGEEASVIGSTMALKKQDKILTTHRGHGECIGKGVDIKAMMAEILGRSAGTNYGRGGSMHITDPENGVIGSNGIVGADAPVGCGVALGIKLKKLQDTIAVCFFGDGAINQGAVLESMNLAVAWKLPLLFIVTDNGYAVSTKTELSTGEPDIAKRGPAFGLETFEEDGNDVEAVYRRTAALREHILESGRPCMLILHTYRTAGHSRSDRNVYRSKEEIQNWEDKNPIKLYSEKLISSGIMTADEIETIRAQAESDVKAAQEFAKAQPFPDVTDLLSEVYA